MVGTAKKPCAGGAEARAWQSRGHVNLESSSPAERCLTFACIVSSSCAEAKGSGHGCLRAQTRLRRALFSERLDARELVLLGLALPPSKGFARAVRAWRTLSAEEVCWGLGSGWGIPALALVLLVVVPQRKQAAAPRKPSLAVAGGSWDFKMPARALQVSCPQFCLAQPCWQSLDV